MLKAVRRCAPRWPLARFSSMPPESGAPRRWASTMQAMVLTEVGPKYQMAMETLKMPKPAWDENSLSLSLMSGRAPTTTVGASGAAEATQRSARTDGGRGNSPRVASRAALAGRRVLPALRLRGHRRMIVPRADVRPADVRHDV